MKSFFVVSGFLIFMSYENTRDVGKYFSKRARRIYPAYFFVVVVCAFAGVIFSTYSWRDYISFDVLEYIAANLVFLNFLHPDLPGLFANNTLQAVNGALWTLKIEVMFYLLVPVVVMMFRKFGRMRVMLLLIYVQWCIPWQWKVWQAKPVQVPTWNCSDRYGADIFSCRRPVTIIFNIWLNIAYGFSDGCSVFHTVKLLPRITIQPVALGVLVVYFACVFPCLGNFGKYGDFSYGIYIVHFPILQTLIAYGLFKGSPWLMLVVAGFLVMTAAILFWHFIEKPFLRKSSHYVATSHG